MSQQIDLLVRKAGAYLDYKLSSGLPNNASELFNHAISGNPEVPSKIVEDITPTKNDVVICERLLKAYNKASLEQYDKLGSKQDIWSVISGLQTNIFLLLKKNDPKLLANTLCNMYRYEIGLGLMQSKTEYEKITTKKAYRHFWALFTKDRLVSLAEAIGAIAYENPEQGNWGKSIHFEIDYLVERIEEVLGVDITPPPIDGGCLKICSSKGALFNEKDVYAIYAAFTIKQLLENDSLPKVCEIGAGTGRTAYYCSKFGINNYTIFDLPLSNLIQGFYLLKTMPTADVRLYGEEPSDNVNILPYWKFSDFNKKHFDLTFNQDSFPEIDECIVTGYLETIKKNTNHYFLSVNQESQAGSWTLDKKQLNVPNIVKSVGGYSKLYRYPYWLRRGYVQELYKVQ